MSCFGPFKESTVIPNLLDRSFEEVRLDFMEASKNGTAQQHINELIAQYNDSMAKLNHLKMANPDTIQLVANIYNQSVQEQKATIEATPAATNVFAQTSTPLQQNPFHSSSVSSGGLMKTSFNYEGSTFQAPTQNSIFGAPKEQSAPVVSNFTFSLGPQAPQQSIFGTTQQQPPQSSIFGSVQPIQQPQATTSIFGGQANTFGSASVFPVAMQQQNQAPQSTSVFGSSIFPQSQPAPVAAGIFGTPLQNTVQNQPFQQQQPVTGNVFGGFQSQPIQSDPQVQHTGNIFAQAAYAPSQNVFNMQQTVQVQQPPTSAPTSIFQIQQPNSNTQQMFGANPFQTQPPPIDESVYSKPEDLTPDEIQAFQADTFQLGSIPSKPPPRHLCF